MSWGQVGLPCSCHEAGSGSSVPLALSLTWAGWAEVGAGASSPERGRLHFLYPTGAQKAACRWQLADSSMRTSLCLHLHRARISCYHNIMPIITAVHALYKHSFH